MNLTIHVTVPAGGHCVSLFPVALLGSGNIQVTLGMQQQADLLSDMTRDTLGSAVRSLPQGFTQWSNRCVRKHC